MSSKKLKNSPFTGRIIKKLRENINLSVYELAKQASIDLGMLKNCERLANNPNLETMLILSKFFSVSFDYLYVEHDTPYIGNMKLLHMANTIDKADYDSRLKLEMNIRTLLRKKGLEKKLTVHFDNPALELTGSIHQNIKLLRENQEITQKELAEKIEVSKSLITHYQTKSVPTAEKLVKLSSILGVSIHALCTGEKLTYDFKNQSLKEIICKADKLLNLEDQKILIHLMTRIIEDS